MTGAIFACPRCGTPVLLEPTPDGHFLKPDGDPVGVGCDALREWTRQGLTLTENCPVLATEAARLRAIADARGRDEPA